MTAEQLTAMIDYARAKINARRPHCQFGQWWLEGTVLHLPLHDFRDGCSISLNARALHRTSIRDMLVDQLDYQQRKMLRVA